MTSSSDPVQSFKKCDMHVHSSSCYSRRYARSDFISTVLNSDLDVIAITDHNIVDVGLLEEISSGMRRLHKTAFGGVELNIHLKDETIQRYKLTRGTGRKGAYFHAIVWFDIRHAEAMAKIVHNLFVQKLEEQRGVEGVEYQDEKAFSRATEGVSIALEDFQEAAAGIPYIFVPHENKDRSLSDYLPNRASNKGRLLENQEYKDKLFYFAHASAIEGGEKSRQGITEWLAKENNVTVSAFLFSDAKSLDEIGKRFTWIDFDGDWDSLLLAMSDPESRIVTSDRQEKHPQKNIANYLESISFSLRSSQDQDLLRSVTLRFSPGYNGIVGSRGSGKSMLASLLVLNGQERYKTLVDIESVRYQLHDGESSKDRPRCLYLGQGALETIFEKCEYDSIPFLKTKIDALKEEEKVRRRSAKEHLNELLTLEKRLLIAFSEKYECGVISLDHLDFSAPSGILITKPESPSSVEEFLRQLKVQWDPVSTALKDGRKNLCSFEYPACAPEDGALLEALKRRANDICNALLEVDTMVNSYISSLKNIRSEWFICRKQLLDEYLGLVDEFNSHNGSNAASRYEDKDKLLSSFYSDLLTLRVMLKYLHSTAIQEFDKGYCAGEESVYQTGDNVIQINLRPNDDYSFEEIYRDLFAKSPVVDESLLIDAYLCGSEASKMHKVFNGNKFKSCKDDDIKSHFEQFFNLLGRKLNNLADLKPCIAVDGVQIDTMSPGMKAQALLKLFLNDQLCEGGWVYVVLDQPEDNLDVKTIKDFLVDRLKRLKISVQLFVVSHSAPVIVNGDARTVVTCRNENEEISYEISSLGTSAGKRFVSDVLDGGERYLKMRLNKYNFRLEDLGVDN
jgi:hypothetical protein